MSQWVGESKAGERARWLSELADAIDQAQRLLWSLASADQASVEARALYGELEAVRGEIDSLRRGATAHEDEQLDDIGQWLSSLAWNQVDKTG